ncbi:MAG: beta strand repeat-containing protein [Isosphaerales bacterium]
MRLLQSLNRIGDRAHCESRRSRSRRARPIVSCESLETRALLSALTITGSQLNVTLGAIQPSDRSTGVLEVTQNGVTTNYPLTQFTGVNIIATGSSNNVNVFGTLSTVPVSVNLGTGAGTVVVGNNLANVANIIAGNVTVVGGNSADALTVNDQGAQYEEAYAITASTVTGTYIATITYSNIGHLYFNGGSAPDTFGTPQDTYNIESTAGSTTTQIVGGSCNNIFNVSPAANNLSNLGGALTIAGHAQGVQASDTLNIDDQSGTSYNSETYEITSSTVSRTGAAATITYGSMSNVNINGGGTGDYYNIESTPSGTAMTVEGGSGNDTFNVSPTAKSLGTIQGNLTVAGLGGSNKLFIDDQNNSANDTYTLASSSVTSSSVTRTGAATISYASDGAVNLYGGSGNDTYDINGTPSGTTATITGGTGTNTLVGANTTNTWSITAKNAGTVNVATSPSVAFSGIKNLTGGTGLDVFVFSAGATVTGKINGGGGGDWLDYAAYTTPVAVNLQKGTASGVGGGIANIQNVRGGQGADNLTGNKQGNVLIGGAGANQIKGGAGKSILSGGKGKDTVTGSSAGDILIGGYTSYDSSTLANDMALQSILTEWQSGASYATRISTIKSGVGPGSSDTLVWGSTVHDNGKGKANKLTGAGAKKGLNWFFASKATKTNRTRSEQLN